MPSVIVPSPVSSGCVGCNEEIRNFEFTMREMPGFFGIDEYIAHPEPRPIFLLDGVEVDETHIVALVPGLNGYLLMNWNDGRGAIICECPSLAFAPKRNLFRGNVQIKRSPQEGLIVPVGSLPS